MKLAEEIVVHWASIAPLLSIHNEQEYDRAVKLLNELIDVIGDDERHPLYSLLDTLGAVLHAYEARHFQMPMASGDLILEVLNGRT